MVKNMPHVSLERIPRSRILIIFICANLLFLVLGLIVGKNMSTAQSEALASSQEKLTVTTKIEKRQVGQATVLQGKVQLGKTEPYSPAVGAERAVVTRVAVEPGRTIHPGDLVATISDVPIIAMPDSIPFYRTIKKDDSGSDVLALQQTLTNWGYAPGTGGTWSEQSMKAYQSFLYNLGVANGDVESIDWKTFMLVPSAGRTVETIAAQGTVLGENPLLTTRNGSPTIVARATIDVTRDLHVGSTAEAKSAGGASGTATVTAISEFNATGDIPGKDVTFTVPEGFQAPDGASATLEVKSSGDPTLAVPITALREKNGEEYLRLHNGEEVTVTVVRQAEGWAAIKSDHELREGTDVEIPTP